MTPERRQEIERLYQQGEGFAPRAPAHELRDAVRDLLAALTRAEGLATATQAFLAKLDALMPAINGAFAFQQNHGFPYVGPMWEAELDALRRADAAWRARDDAP